jgi:hypothetical protein
MTYSIFNPGRAFELSSKIRILNVVHRLFDKLPTAVQREHDEALQYSLQTLSTIQASLDKEFLAESPVVATPFIAAGWDHRSAQTFFIPPIEDPMMRLIQAQKDLEKEWQLIKRDYLALVEYWIVVFREAGFGELVDWLSETFQYARKHYSELRGSLKAIVKKYSLRYRKSHDKRGEHKKKHQVIFKQIDDEDHN